MSISYIHQVYITQLSQGFNVVFVVEVFLYAHAQYEFYRITTNSYIQKGGYYYGYS